MAQQHEASDRDTGASRDARIADAAGEHEPDRSSAQQAVVNEEHALESGEENPS